MRKNIAVVPQDVFLFSESIEENIKFACESATLNDVKIACEKACAKEFVESLEEKYATVIGERGIGLSGGQKQRLSIARAIMKNPPILILDEATSSLDTASEKIVQQALDEIAKGKTVITIAHRLSTIMDSDKIIVIDDGHIIEEGTHKELYDKNGIYRKLVENQALEFNGKSKTCV